MTDKNQKTIRLNKDQTMSLYRAKENELQGIGQRLKEIDNVFLEISKAENTLNEIKNVKNSEKLLINIGAGILIECVVSKTENVKVSLPGQVMVSKNIDDVIKDIVERKNELLDLKKKFSESYNNNIRTLREISKALEKMHSKNIDESDKHNVS